MVRKLISYALVIILTIILTTVFQPLSALGSLASPAAQGNCQTFPQTGKNICDRFLEYWQQHGGLAQQGYPVTGTFSEKSDTDGKSYTVQYFERAVFEYHPENAAPNDVLLSLLGTFELQRKYNGQDPSIANPAPPAPPSGQPAPPPTWTAAPAVPTWTAAPVPPTWTAAPIPPTWTAAPIPPAPPTQAPTGQRCGAVCNDGTTSTATGSGACSHHGGVNYWIYCDLTAP